MIYKTGKMFLFDHISLFKQFSIARDTDSVINQTIHSPCRSIKGILLLFVEPYTAGVRLSQKFFNSDITSMKVTIDGTPNRVFSQGSFLLICGMKQNVISCLPMWERQRLIEHLSIRVVISDCLLI